MISQVMGGLPPASARPEQSRSYNPFACPLDLVLGTRVWDCCSVGKDIRTVLCTSKGPSTPCHSLSSGAPWVASCHPLPSLLSRQASCPCSYW